MTTNHPTNQTAAAAVRRSPAVEKRFAAAELAAPAATAGLMMCLDPAAATTVTTFLAVPAVIAAANAAGLISDAVLDKAPGGDIIRAHRVPFAVSTTAAIVAATTGATQGVPGVVSLFAGWMEMPTLAGLVSAAWLGASGYVAYSLSRVLRRRPAPAAAHAPAATPGEQPEVPNRDILQLWADYISGEGGTNPGQHLQLTARGPHAWAGIIHSPAPGKPVSVTRETVSGVYQLPTGWVTITDGPHGSAKHITVRTAPPSAEEEQGHELELRWLKHVARSGGVLAGTHLEDVTADPNTGGHAAWVVADDNLDAIPRPDMFNLAGAMRSRMLLVSFEPTDDPRRAIFRIMDRSPLEEGRHLPDAETLRANENGFIKLGIGVSGRPARIQICDPQAGAQHVLISGVTGSGKGGVLQLLCLSYHVNGFAIIYADPKGSSNPDVEQMAAYAGCGLDEAMGALRVAHAIFQNRVAESHGSRAKNFKPTPERPYVAVVLDEMMQILGDKSPHKAEAVRIISTLAALGRSLGICVVLCGQVMNLAQMGSDASIRNNVYGGGALILLRSDSDQKNRIDLPENFAGIDPSKIPAYWKSDNDRLIYDPSIPENDPRRTFGVFYGTGPDGRPEQSRAWILESATEAGLWDPENIVIPADFPDWADREAIAAASIDGEDDEDGASVWMPAQTVPALTKEPTAREKVLQTLAEFADPMGEGVNYLHVDQITKMTGLAPGTVANACTELMKDKKIIRSSEKGMYGIPISPATD